MFSGIISDIGSVIGLETGPDSTVLKVKAVGSFANSESPLKIGDSIAISGTCLTVISFDSGVATFDVGSETLRKTTLGQLQQGSEVNIERALRVGDRLDGHMVLGHVDDVVELLEVAREDNTIRLLFELPSDFREFLVPKGSVTLDGVSLTVGEVEEASFSVYVVPHTWEVTVCKNYSVGSRVNFEVDMIARYLKGLVADRTLSPTLSNTSAGHGRESGRD